jgi:hypothetical protein
MQEMQESSSSDGDKPNFKVVYTIVERGSGMDRKKLWLRIGTAFVNRDQSMNVRLDAHPTNGALHIRDYVPYEDRRRNDEPPATGGVR